MEVKRYKAGKLKGEITTAEIRKLIRAHNKASSIKIPPKSTREDIIGILQKAGYSVNHEKAELRPVSKGKVQKLKVVSQKTIEKELPKPKTEEEKKEAKKKREAKKQIAETKAFEKRKKQVEAIEKVKARRKKGEIKAPKEIIYPEFDNMKKLEKYYREQLDKFLKTEGMKFVNRIKAPNITIKEIKDQRKELRLLGRKRVLDILDANEDLFVELDDEDDTKYSELEELFDKRFETIFNRATARINELKGK